MQILWKLEKAYVKEIISEMPEPKPAYNTISTIVRILEQKGFVGHEPIGKSHQYHPLVDQETYSNNYLKSFIGSYFGGSFEKMVSFFVKKNNMTIQEMEELMKELEDQKEDDNNDEEKADNA
ncbi:BlaI/MecI/CopY family transcriptional regulator [Limibacter armeniacum]|uniref:BlaI/MecI/CopY family transcriptional regulator n=1 Tax=Limibacter armeniacum TaxID=466084 RepID=UPI0038CC140C